MHATVRHYQATGDRTEELARAVREVASSLSKIRGFVSCLVLEVEPGVLVSVSIFEDQHSLAEAHDLFEASFAGERSYLLSAGPQIVSGEIVFQRGL